MTTILELAREYDAQPHEIAAALDLKNYPHNEDITEYTEAEAREILDLCAATATALTEDAE